MRLVDERYVMNAVPMTATIDTYPSQRTDGSTQLQQYFFDTSKGALISADVFWTGAPNGTWSILGSNSFDPLKGTGQWTDITATIPEVVPAAGVVGGFSFQRFPWGYKYIRFRYNFTSGTGAASVYIVLKGN